MNTSESANPEDLITRARRGDTSAFGCLLEISRNYLKLMARLQLDKRVQAKVDPSDLVQESFLNAHQNFHTFRGTTERELLAWLRQILVHSLADHVRRYYGTRKLDVSLDRSRTRTGPMEATSWY